MNYFNSLMVKSNPYVVPMAFIVMNVCFIGTIPLITLKKVMYGNLD